MSHRDLVERINYALNGPGHSRADAYWATVVKVTGNQDQTHSPLLRLPAELRNSIYEHVNSSELAELCSIAKTRHDRCSHGYNPCYEKCLRFPFPHFRNLTLVCRQLYLETQHLPLQLVDPRMRFKEPDYRHRFTNDLNMRSITGLVVHLGAGEGCARSGVGGDDMVSNWAQDIQWALKRQNYPWCLVGKATFPALQHVYVKLCVQENSRIDPKNNPDEKAEWREAWENAVSCEIGKVRKSLEVRFEYEITPRAALLSMFQGVTA